MSESLGVKAYQAIYEGNGESIMTRVKVLETKVDLWHNLSVKLLIGGVLAFLSTIAQLLYHLMDK